MDFKIILHQSKCIFYFSFLNLRERELLFIDPLSRMSVPAEEERGAGDRSQEHKVSLPNQRQEPMDFSHHSYLQGSTLAGS